MESYDETTPYNPSFHHLFEYLVHGGDRNSIYHIHRLSL